jgi:succinoglycan biosynthesis protein ExoM
LLAETKLTNSELTKLKSNKPKLDISVCIATFRRPSSLARLLNGLQGIDGTKECAIEIVVVDNDAAQTAKQIVEEFQQSLPSLYYFVEPRQNIALARNRAVESAQGEWIAFIDDDEIPSKNWLMAYWVMLRQSPGDGYFGPVLPILEQPAPSWLDKDVFFGRSRYPTGTKLQYTQTRTTNALIKSSLFDTFKFDPRFGLTGSSDTELFARMIDAGANFYWCDDAITYEYFSTGRMRLSWLMQRAFRGGMTYTNIEKQRQPVVFQKLLGFIKALTGIFIFAFMLPFEVLRGRKLIIKRILRICVQIGHIWAFFNLSYEEYKLKN